MLYVSSFEPPNDTLEPPQKRKRSILVDSDTHLHTRLQRANDLCKRIANGQVTGFTGQIGNTQQVLLTLGATYVFSWAINEIISAVGAFRYNAFTEI